MLAALVFGAPANAADAPIKGPYYKAAPVFSWTGFYIGAHVGYGWGDAFDGAAFVDIDGAFGGAQLGYNWQFNRNWVFGIETDISASDIGVGGFNVDWFGSTRVRLGYAMDRTLFYATAGIGYAGTNFSSGQSAAYMAPASNGLSHVTGRPRSNISITISATSLLPSSRLRSRLNSAPSSSV